MCHHPLQVCDSELGKSTATGLFPWKYLEKGMCTQESFWGVLPMLTVGKTWKQEWQKWLSHKGIHWPLRTRATSSIPFVPPQLQRPWSLFSQWISHVKHHPGRAILEGAPVRCCQMPLIMNSRSRSALVMGVLSADVRGLYCHKHYLESFLQEMCE